MKTFFFRILLLSFFASAAVFAQSAETRPLAVSQSYRANGDIDQPNIVFIFADDLGTGDLACYGHPYALTPNIDRLAKEGTKFTRYYATGVTCCPSRTGFMTSHHPSSYEAYPADFGFGDKITVTELLHKNGYATGHFGKWHIGRENKGAPVDDYGIDEVKIMGGSDGPGRDDDLFAAAMNFIKRHKSEP
ncbi:MAG: sulfatase-like hydrolase/transferase, partial [Verrucomicrobiae bacterium]|nr:sulfatase-like hydrolase/transferase [Verrucomicrobiae bacterium]